MKIKLTAKNAVINHVGDTIEITANGPKQVMDINVTDVKANHEEERRVYIHDKDEQTKIWMC